MAMQLKLRLEMNQIRRIGSMHMKMYQIRRSRSMHMKVYQIRRSGSCAWKYIKYRPDRREERMDFICREERTLADS